jgi:hypothetical protein
VDLPDDILGLRSHGYEGSRPDVQRLVPLSASNIIELGCSTGALGEAIKLRQTARVLGVELLEDYARQARERLDRVVVSDAETFARGQPPQGAPFDCLIAADVLEHLVDPWETLRLTVGMLTPAATVIVSVPNVFYWKTLRQALATRRWPREDQGIFDRTHLRWFGPGDARELLAGAGLVEVEDHPKYWSGGWRLALVEALAHTPAADFLPAQLLVTGTVPVKGPR